MTKKNILVSVVGLSPQVVTETLYGIIKSDPSEGFVWPDEVKIITTKLGKEQAQLGLNTPSELTQKSMLEQLCIDYDMPLPKFTVDDILVVPDADGVLVDDATTKHDQEALADFIVSTVAKYRNDEAIGQIHASIAGGRKTMTFFLGYALSLFAEDGDKLSHVLVDRQYEGLRDFYYPTPYTKKVAGRSPNVSFDAKNANVMLADIPFIRHRQTLKKAKNLTALETISYRDLAISQNALSDISTVSVEVNRNLRHMIVEADDFKKVVDFSNNYLALAFWSMIVTHTQSGDYAIKRPEDTEQYLAWIFITELEKLAGLDTRDYSTSLADFDIDEYYDTIVDRLVALNEEQVFAEKISVSHTKKYGSSKSRSKKSLENAKKELEDIKHLSEEELALLSVSETLRQLKDGMSPEFFSDKLNQLKEIFETQFSKEFAYILTPAQVYVKEHAPIKRDFRPMKGQQKEPYGLWIDENKIMFKDSKL